MMGDFSIDSTIARFLASRIKRGRRRRIDPENRGRRWGYHRLEPTGYLSQKNSHDGALMLQIWLRERWGTQTHMSSWSALHRGMSCLTTLPRYT